MPLFVLIFNKIFAHVSYPQLWAQNFLKPIFKKGECWDTNNYRGIAVGSAMGKLFSLILLERLENRIQRTNPISENQIGFKKGHRTADHIFVINTIVNKIVKVEKKKLFSAFIDFEKAYDRVNRNLLFLKLQRLGINGLFYRNIKAMYKNVSYLVKLTKGLLDRIGSSLGLKQGGVLSPLLFNLFIDDMKKIFDESCDPIMDFVNPLSHLLYADDLVLISSSQSGLNSCLVKLETFCDKWHLGVNIKKSKIVIFNPSGRKMKEPAFCYNGTQLETVQSYCYLGIDLSSSGSFTRERGNLTDKALKAMFPLFSVIADFQIPCTKAMQLFNSLIKPIALYNSENWATLTPHQISAIQQNKTSLFSYMTGSETSKVHLKFVKYILGVKRNCSNVAALGEMGELPLLLHGFKSLLVYWHRTVNLPQSTLAHKALKLQFETSTELEWAATVKFLLTTLGMESYFNNPDLVTTQRFSVMCAKKLSNLCIRQWYHEVTGVSMCQGNTSKLRFYKLFKTSFKMEPYLSSISNFHLRKCISKFRCSDHSLEIEVGRHKKLKVEERVCKLCQIAVETEEHFLRFCPKFNELRHRYFGNTCSFAEWIRILKCEEKQSSYNLANFLKKGFEIRKELLAMP